MLGYHRRSVRSTHVQPSWLRPLQEDHLDWLRPACGAGPRRGAAREPLHVPLIPASTPARPRAFDTKKMGRAQMKAVVVGGVAGGMSFAARARRLAEDAEIVVLERDPYVSYANCGLPYHLGGEIGDRDALLLHTPQSLAASLALDVRTGHEVLAIDPAGRPVFARELATGRDYREAYDALLLSPGAAPVIPPVPGAGLPAVRVLRTVPDVDVLRAMVARGARRAVIVGAGFIGLESAEALRHRGLAVTLVELAGQVMPALDPEMARSIELELLRAGVEVRLGTSVTALREAGGGTVAADLSDGSQVLADLGPAECRHDHRHAPSPPPEHDAVTAVGISPGDGPLTVAHLIARAALETLLVVEQDAAVGGGNEQRGRACVHTVLGRAGAADIGVHGDMRPFPDPELHGGHPLIERHCRVTHRFRSLIGMPASPASRRGPDPAAGPY